MVSSILATCSSQAQSIEQNYLVPHNAARKLVGVGLLVWDDNVEAHARNYANLRKVDCKLHPSGGPYGENLFWWSRSFFDDEDAVMDWVDEKQ